MIRQGNKLVTNIKSLKQSMNQRLKRENGSDAKELNDVGVFSERVRCVGDGALYKRPRKQKAGSSGDLCVNQNIDNRVETFVESNEEAFKRLAQEHNVNSLLDDITRLKAAKSKRAKHKMFSIQEEEGECDGDC